MQHHGRFVFHRGGWEGNDTIGIEQDGLFLGLWYIKNHVRSVNIETVVDEQARHGDVAIVLFTVTAHRGGGGGGRCVAVSRGPVRW